MRILLLAVMGVFAVSCSEGERRSVTPAPPVAGAAVSSTDYEPMMIFSPIAGKVLRGEGAGPDGKTVIDYAAWQFILGGRAFQSSHLLEDGSYGGRTIFFYDEAAKSYIFHYYTTAGFHTTGTAAPTEKGFTSVEKVIGHQEFAEVRAEIVFEGDVIRVLSSHVKLDGTVSDVEEGFVYKVIDLTDLPAGHHAFFDEADALFGKAANLNDAVNRYKDAD